MASISIAPTNFSYSHSPKFIAELRELNSALAPFKRTLIQTLLLTNLRINKSPTQHAWIRVLLAPKCAHTHTHTSGRVSLHSTARPFWLIPWYVRISTEICAQLLRTLVFCTIYCHTKIVQTRNCFFVVSTETEYCRTQTGK